MYLAVKPLKKPINYNSYKKQLDLLYFKSRMSNSTLKGHKKLDLLVKEKKR